MPDTFCCVCPLPLGWELFCALGDASSSSGTQRLSCLPSLSLCSLRNKWWRTASRLILRDKWGSQGLMQRKRSLLPALGTAGYISCFGFGSNVNSSESPPCPPLQWLSPVIPTLPCSLLVALTPLVIILFACCLPTSSCQDVCKLYEGRYFIGRILFTAVSLVADTQWVHNK